MQTRVIRPNVRFPDQFVIELDKAMLQWLQDGVLTKIFDVRQSIYTHDECDLASDTGCRIRAQWLIDNYGSLEQAAQAGFHRSDCAEDLTFLHAELGRLMAFLNQSRWIQNNPNGRCMLDQRDAVAKLTELKGEVAYRNEASRSDTGVMPKLDEEALARLDDADGKWPSVPVVEPQQDPKAKLLDLKVPEVPKPVSGGARVKKA